MKRVFLYVRVSTEEQAIHGLSIDAQTAALTAWAQQNHCQVAGVYTDAGISARKPASKRPELQRLLGDVADGLGDMIIFTKLDRWFRNISEYYKVQEILEKHRVTWKTIQEDYDTSTASGRLKVNIMLSVAQDEADRTGERIKFIFQDKVQRGEVISGKVPLGYKIEDKKMVPDPQTAPIAQDIFKQYLAIRSVRALGKYVMDKYGLIYGNTGLRMLLQNQRYIGRAHEQDDFCPPLIDPADFQLCQEIIQQRSQRNAVQSKHVYLFTGLVRCGECGNRLSAHMVNQKYIYYRCTRYEKLGLCSHKKRTSERVLEKWLLENLISSYETYNMNARQALKANPPKQNAEKLRRRMEKLKDLYLNDLIDRDLYERDYLALRNALREAEAVRIAQPKLVDIAAFTDMLKLYKDLSRTEQKEFWNRVIGEITISKDDSFFVSPVRHR